MDDRASVSVRTVQSGRRPAPPPLRRLPTPTPKVPRVTPSPTATPTPAPELFDVRGDFTLAAQGHRGWYFHEMWAGVDRLMTARRNRYGWTSWTGQWTDDALVSDHLDGNLMSPGLVHLHPGNPYIVVVAWQAPSTGLSRHRLAIRSANATFNGVGYTWKVAGTVRASGTLAPYQSAALDESLAMVAGTRARLELDCLGANNGADGTNLSWTIDWQRQVP